MNTTELRVELLRLERLLATVPDEPFTRQDARQVKQVWEALHGNDRVTTNQPEVPFDKRIDALHRCVPKVMAWCVMKYDSSWLSSNEPERVTVWPGQAYGTHPCAEHWRDFLEDYYRDTHVRSGKVRWVCERRLAQVGYYNDEPIAPGTGYYPDERRGWTGTLPMEVFEYDRDKRAWRRKP